MKKNPTSFQNPMTLILFKCLGEWFSRLSNATVWQEDVTCCLLGNKYVNSEWSCLLPKFVKDGEESLRSSHVIHEGTNEMITTNTSTKMLSFRKHHVPKNLSGYFRGGTKISRPPKWSNACRLLLAGVWGCSRTHLKEDNLEKAVSWSPQLIFSGSNYSVGVLNPKLVWIEIWNERNINYFQMGSVNSRF